MREFHKFTRTMVGLAFLALSGAMFREALVSDIFDRFSPTGEISLLSISMISGLSLPPLLTGLHTLLFRRLRNSWLKQEFQTTILGSLAVGFFADFYMAYSLGRPISFALLVGMTLVGAICLFVIRRAPEGPIRAAEAQDRKRPTIS